MREYQISMSLYRPRKDHAITVHAEGECSVYDVLSVAYRELLRKIKFGAWANKPISERAMKKPVSCESWEGSMTEKTRMFADIMDDKTEADRAYWVVRVIDCVAYLLKMTVEDTAQLLEKHSMIERLLSVYSVMSKHGGYAYHGEIVCDWLHEVGGLPNGITFERHIGEGSNEG